MFLLQNVVHSSVFPIYRKGKFWWNFPLRLWGWKIKPFSAKLMQQSTAIEQKIDATSSHLAADATLPDK